MDVLNNKNVKTILDRYIYTSHWCRGKRVLDICSGKGIGAMQLITLGTKSVQCVDFDPKAKDAINNYKCKNIDFTFQDVTKKFSLGQKFDVVVSIETFEHLPKEDIKIFLQNLKRHCKNNGAIIITTPIRKTPKFIYTGGTHLYEYTPKEFDSQFIRVFKNWNITKQSLIEYRVIHNGQLQSELVNGVPDNSMLFFYILRRKDENSNN